MDAESHKRLPRKTVAPLTRAKLRGNALEPGVPRELHRVTELQKKTVKMEQGRTIASVCDF